MSLHREDKDIGSLHWLKGKGGTRRIFEWTKGGWSSPGTGFHTRSSVMSVLGWQYDGPASDDEVKKLNVPSRLPKR